MDTNAHSSRNQELTGKDFARLAEFIHAEFGIKMPLAKKTMLEARLQKRLRLLGIPNFSHYIDYLFSPAGMDTELIAMIDAVTTNKTDFFREPDHFDYLTRTALPQLLGNDANSRSKRLAFWSAGCSTGEEPYTLAMMLKEYHEQNPVFSYHILATDISSRVLKHAATGIYQEERVKPVPAAFKRKYLMRNKDKTKDVVRIVPELRASITFQRLNFMDDTFSVHEAMDVIFCRNVIIYFDRDTQAVLLQKLVSHLKPGGFLFMGHSETLNNLNLPVVQIAAAAYRKRQKA